MGTSTKEFSREADSPRNNAFLAAAKKRLTRRVFQTVSDILNVQGQEDAQRYIAQILDTELQERMLALSEERDGESEE